MSKWNRSILNRSDSVAGFKGMRLACLPVTFDISRDCSLARPDKATRILNCFNPSVPVHISTGVEKFSCELHTDILRCTHLYRIQIRCNVCTLKNYLHSGFSSVMNELVVKLR